MMQYVISFLVLLNPFALFMYLNPIAKDLGQRDFLGVLIKAGGLSLSIFVLTALFGDFIFTKLLFIDFHSFKIFGGVVITIYALIFILKGNGSFFILKGTLEDLAAEIALPFMVGAATVSLSIIIGSKFAPLQTLTILFVSMAIHIAAVFFLSVLKHNLFKENNSVAFDKLMGMFLRLNGFIVGTIGLSLIIAGVKESFGIQ